MDTTTAAQPAPVPTVVGPLTQSTSIGALAAALAIAQGGFEAASKDRNNPYFGSRYATLSSVWDACREGLSKNALAVIQQVSRAGAGEISVRTMLVHASGEWMASIITLPVMPIQKRDGTETKVTAQSYGSAITYGRRYGLAAMVGIAPDDDDDGNTASHAEPPAPRALAPNKAAAAKAHADATRAAKERDAKAEKPEAQRETGKLVENPGKPDPEAPTMVFGKDKGITGKRIATLTKEELEWSLKEGRAWINDPKNKANPHFGKMSANLAQLMVESGVRGGQLKPDASSEGARIEKEEPAEPGSEG